MIEPSAAEALELLEQVRGFYGLSASGVRAEQEPQRTQLCQAYPLLCMMVARLKANPGETERADIKHGWQKALRRRCWDVLPSLDASGRPSARPGPGQSSVPPRPGLSSAPPRPGQSSAPPAPSAPPVPDPALGAVGAAGPLADTTALGPKIAGFLAMFGVAIDPTVLPLQMFPTLPAELARLAPMAQRLRAGPLLPPTEYAEAWGAIADAWNRVVGHSALRIPGNPGGG